ncbi:hypothetical protein JCM33374_g5395 [Metschnikowia sp. JCM 33374]|nr:hypothetical protein JCM33374_g5395 [Metschnikowia sp. JCM 33374]
MLNLDFDHSKFSERKIFLGGISCYLYNSDVLASYVQQLNGQPEAPDSIQINVLYLIHHRGGDYTYMRGVASKLLTQVSNSSDAPIIAVTFDTRNHGEREIEKLRNAGWKSKNETHAMDMVSCIDGGVQDIKLVMDYLGGYLNLERHLSRTLKDNGVKIQFNNILSGYSQGGHTVIRFGNKFPENVSIINPNIGCSDLSTLLINRLKETNTFDKKLFYSSYEELDLDDNQKALYPEAFHNKLSVEDTQIFEDYPFKKIKLFASFYDNDPLVPSAISKSWTDMYLNSNFDSQVYYEEGCVHDITEKMIDNFGAWLVKYI